MFLASFAANKRQVYWGNPLFITGYLQVLMSIVCISNCYKIAVYFVSHQSMSCTLTLSSSGSVTLHQWQQLAKPNLGGILHPRPGVLTKDFRELEVDIQHVYSLNDLEEDEPDLSHFSGAHGMGRTLTDRPTGFVIPIHVISNPCVLISLLLFIQLCIVFCPINFVV